MPSTIEVKTWQIVNSWWQWVKEVQRFLFVLFLFYFCCKLMCGNLIYVKTTFHVWCLAIVFHCMGSPIVASWFWRMQVMSFWTTPLWSMGLCSLRMGIPILVLCEFAFKAPVKLEKVGLKCSNPWWPIILVQLKIKGFKKLEELNSNPHPKNFRINFLISKPKLEVFFEK